MSLTNVDENNMVHITNDISEEKIDKIVRMVQTGKIDFPFKKYTVTPDEIDEMFLDLVQYKFNLIYPPEYEIYNLQLTDPDLLKFKLKSGETKYMLLLQEKDQYRRFGKIVDFFQEPVRINAKRCDHDKTTWNIGNQKHVKLSNTVFKITEKSLPTV